MLGTILKTGLKYINLGWKSYCTAKIGMKTGMTMPEIFLYKELVKDCNKYYSSKISIFLKECTYKLETKVV